MHCIRLLLSLVAGLLVALPSTAQERRQVPEFTTYGQPGSIEDAAAIDSLLAQFKRSWGDQDVTTLMALHAEDVEWINAYARIFQGNAALGKFLSDRLFPAFDPDVSRREADNMTAISRRYVGDDAAILHLYTDGNRGESRNVGEEMRRTHLHLILGKKDGDWRIVHTAIMDAR